MRLRTSLLLLSFTALQPALWAQTFNPGAKKDPFVDLTRVQRAASTTSGELPPLSQRPPGLAGLAIQEVIVTGMAIGEDSKIVLLRGVDNFTYLAREGARLFDGSISSISQEEVTFSREYINYEGEKEVNRIVKRLYTEE